MTRFFSRFVSLRACFLNLLLPAIPTRRWLNRPPCEPGQSMGQSFGLRWGTPLNDGVVHLPDASGTYELRFMVAERTGQHTIRRGPRVVSYYLASFPQRFFT